MDITKLSLPELKSLAYDVIKDLNRCQCNLSALNNEIAKREEEDKQVNKKKK